MHECATNAPSVGAGARRNHENARVSALPHRLIDDLDWQAAEEIRDIAESLEGWGIKALFVLSGHGSNPQPVKHAIRELIHEKHRIRVLNALYLGLETMLAEADSPRWASDLHAEEIETSLMLAIAPELVHMDRAVADYPPVPPDYGHSELSMGHIMRSGVFGDPTRATAEKGHRWIGIGAEQTAALWLAYLARHRLFPPGREA